MKRILSLMLAVIMLVTSLPVVSSALTHAQFDYVLSPYTTLGFEYSHTTKMGVETLYNGAYPYFHLTAEAGEYSNGDLIFSFKPLNTRLSDKPYVKICYRTDSPAPFIDVSMNSPNGEKWMETHPAIISDGNYNTLIFNYNDITGSTVAFPDEGESNIKINLKPFGVHKFTLNKDSYFDINYIALFETRAEAEAFTYNDARNINSGYKHNILSPDALFSYYGGASATESVTYNYISSESAFVRYLAAPGTYNNNDLIVHFSHDAFSLLEYPYVNVCYKTDSPASRLDISMTSESGENWLSGAMPSLTNNGKVSNVIFSINDMTGSSAPAPNPGSMNITVRLKPWGSGDKTLTKQSYFDIMYVGFFKTRDEAENFVYLGNSKYKYNFMLNDSVPPYYFASKATVKKYIDEADARSYEIIHSNNTVPFIKHLDFAGMTGAYSGDRDKSTFKITAPAGSYSESTGVITFTEKDFAMGTLPYLKLSYTTDSDDTLKVYAVKNSGSSTELTLKNGIYDLTGTDAVSIKIMPFGTGSRTLACERHFTLDYIGFFKTEAKARAFVYAGENGANMTKDHVIYTADLLDPASTVSGTVHYVSSSTGNDNNDGLTPETAWKTINKLNSAKPRGTVFFKRGDSFRYTGTFNTQSNTVYTSYGFGDKPKLIASIDGADASLWKKTGRDNVWVFSKTIANKANPLTDNIPDGDVGHIRINGGELWGIKVVKRNDSDMRHDNGDVFNGRAYIPATSNKAVEGGLGLYYDLEFHHDYDTGKLYLYCADGNPGEVFDSIEIADKGNAIGNQLSNSTVDNLYVTGTGSHGLGYGNVNDSAVTNCHLEWIGGSIQTLVFSEGATVPTRFGNAVESYGNAVNFTIANCFASQVYDCCWTVQYMSAANFKNIFMYDNVSEYANSGLEIWQSGGVTDDLYLHDNYTMYGGYGWSHQRPNKDGNFFYGGTGINATTYKNCSVENNINVLASSNGVLASALGSSRYNFNHNIYIMGEGKTYTFAPPDTEHGKSPIVGIPYDYTNIQRTYALGTDKGSTFYYVQRDLFNIGDDPYEVFSVCDNPIYDIYAEKDYVMLKFGDTYDIELNVLPVNNDDELYFSSTNPAIATCSQDGRITAASPGFATIIISAVNSDVYETVDVQVIPSVNTTSIWPADSEDGYNTNVLFLGDNFFCGESSVADAFEDEYKITSETYAVPDKTVTDAGYEEYIEECSFNPEVVMLSLGYNDYASSVDITDFEDALVSLLKKIYRRYPESKPILMLPPRIADTENALGYTLSDYIGSAIDICEEFSVGFANLYTMSENSFVLTDKNGNLGQIIYSYLDEDLIPTEKGAALIFDDLIDILVESGNLNVVDEFKYEYRYRANDLASGASGSTGVKYAGKYRDDSGLYVRFTPDGSKTTSSDPTCAQIDFNTSFKITDYPILKIYYRSNIADSAANLDINIGVLKGGATRRLWSNDQRVQYDKSEELKSFTIDLSAWMKCGDGILDFAEVDSNSPIKYVRLKMYNSVRPISANDYFDIESIAFYTDLEQAELDGKPREEKNVIYAKGDVNNDGNVNILDFFILARHNAEWLGYKNEIDFICSDVNTDGYVDLVDTTILARHLALWSEHKILG